MEDPLLQSLQELLLLSDDELRERAADEGAQDAVIMKVATMRQVLSK